MCYNKYSLFMFIFLCLFCIDANTDKNQLDTQFIYSSALLKYICAKSIYVPQVLKLCTSLGIAAKSSGQY